ncbi:MAG: hypothetical protein M1815_003578 [Lichina confinis]|nr:MAG: hypothetical protein M1815_003578 [Lichina confinis]
MKPSSAKSLSILLALASAAVGQIYQYPPLTGPYEVGLTNVEMLDSRGVDVLAPAGGPRDLMVSVFYPTVPTNTSGTRICRRSPVFPPQTAAYFEDQLGLANGTVGRLYGNSCWNVVPGGPDANTTATYPVLLFSPDHGASRLFYAGIAELLSSYGYVVFTIDHPYSVGIVEYPDGRTALRRNMRSPGEVSVLLRSTKRDADFVYSYFRNGTLPLGGTARAFVEGLRRTGDFDRVGVFGHSFGGNTAAAALLNNTAYKCGVNLDGPVFGPAAQAGLDRPFLLVGAETNNRTAYPGWTDFYSNLRGFKRDITIKGTAHQSFTDGLRIQEAIAQGGNGNGTVSGDVTANVTTDITADGTALGVFANSQRADDGGFGTINSQRFYAVLNAYLEEFFRCCLNNETGPLLSGPNPAYPEVEFVG